MHHGQVNVSATALARALVEQFGHLASRRVVVPVVTAGTEVAPFRVGEDLVARLPLVPGEGDLRDRLQRPEEYSRELAEALAVEVPELVGIGEPFEGYPGFGHCGCGCRANRWIGSRFTRRPM